MRPDQQLFRILGYDATERALYYQASPESPDLVVMRVRDGGNPERVVGQPGERVQVSGMIAEEGSTRLVSIETPTSLPDWSVFDRGGRFIGRIPAVRATPLRPPAPEYRKLGPQGFWSFVLRPRDARTGAEAAHHRLHLRRAARQPRPVQRSGLLNDQWLADQGFLVVGFDNRGTPRRGREWERAIRGNFAGVVAGGPGAALQLLGQQVPGGGPRARRHHRLVVRRLRVRAGGAQARPTSSRRRWRGRPVTDQRNYDTFYTERYLGLPEAPGDVYEKNSLLPLAPGLERPLLLVHGTTDDNVYFLHSLLLSDRLFRAGRAHQFLPLSGYTHMVADPVMQESLERRTVEFFRAALGVPEPR